jgi:hypothetical protein
MNQGFTHVLSNDKVLIPKAVLVYAALSVKPTVPCTCELAGVQKPDQNTKVDIP